MSHTNCKNNTITLSRYPPPIYYHPLLLSDHSKENMQFCVTIKSCRLPKGVLNLCLSKLYIHV